MAHFVIAQLSGWNDSTENRRVRLSVRIGDVQLDAALQILSICERKLASIITDGPTDAKQPVDEYDSIGHLPCTIVRDAAHRRKRKASIAVVSSRVKANTFIYAQLNDESKYRKSQPD